MRVDGYFLDRDIANGKKLRGRQINPNSAKEVREHKTNLARPGEVVSEQRASVRMDILRADGTRETIIVPGTVIETITE